jgi:hypothetical protein
MIYVTGLTKLTREEVSHGEYRVIQMRIMMFASTTRTSEFQRMLVEAAISNMFVAGPIRTVTHTRRAEACDCYGSSRTVIFNDISGGSEGMRLDTCEHPSSNPNNPSRFLATGTVC